jgi:hypothetical protein
MSRLPAASAAAAATAALAAVAGLVPGVCSSRASAAAQPAGGEAGGLQLPSSDETKARVVAALGAGPAASPGPHKHRSNGGGSSSLDTLQHHVQDTRRGSSGASSSSALPELASLSHELSGASAAGAGEGAGEPAAGGSSATSRRSGLRQSGLFNSVIGQLRRQQTRRERAGGVEPSDAGGSADGRGACACGRVCGCGGAGGWVGEAVAAKWWCVVRNMQKNKTWLMGPLSVAVLPWRM